MLEKNIFLFGSVNLNEYYDKEKIKELVDAQKACIQNLYTKLFKETKIEQYLHMDLGMELDQKVLQKISVEYAATTNFALKEASGTVNVEDIQHIAEDRRAIVDKMQEIIEEWDAPKLLLAQLTRSNQNNVENESEKWDSSALATTHAPAIPLLNAKDEEWLYDNDNLQQNRSFAKMLLDLESPQGKVNLRDSKDHQDDPEFVMKLEEQLIEDAP